MQEQNSQPLQNPQSLAGPIAQEVQKMNFKKSFPLVLGSFGVVVAGVLAGWLITGKMGLTSSKPTSSGIKVTANEAGILSGNFKGDMAEGILVDGGINGEGAYHLERDGGPVKNVYLTSSVIDLSGFVGKKVEVWGETLAAKKAGWLMDVVKVKVVE